MIQFFGTDLPLAIPSNEEDTGNLPLVFGISEQRRDELITAVVAARNEASKEPVPGMPAHITGFRVSKFVGSVEADADSPSELLFLGMLMGHTYAAMEEISHKSMELMQLMVTNPAKAYKKMMKDFKKQTKKNAK